MALFDTYTSPGVGTASAPAPSAPAAPPPHVQTGAGFTPDYSSLITSDPSYLAAQTNAQQAAASASAQRRAALRQAIIRYGGALPTGFSDQYGDIDQATVDKAGQNQQSTLANLAHDYAQSEEQFKRGLAARGALQSGELNYGEDQLNRGYAQQRYDAANSLGDTVNQALSGYAGVLGQNSRDLASAVGLAEQNVYSNPAYRPSAPSYADYDAENSAKYGQGIYKDGNGVLYDANGNPFTPPSAPTPFATPTDSSGPDTYYQYDPATQQLTSQVGRPASGLWMT